MHYVVASDGQKYGPADGPTLNTWIAAGRVTPASILEDVATGVRLPAASLPGLAFVNPNAASAPSPYPNAAAYPRPGYGAGYSSGYPMKATGGSGRFYGSMALALASIPVAYFVGFFSIVLAGYGVRMAFAAKNEDDHPLGWLAVAVTILATVVMVVVRLGFRYRWN